MSNKRLGPIALANVGSYTSTPRAHEKRIWLFLAVLFSLG